MSLTNRRLEGTTLWPAVTGKPKHFNLHTSVVRPALFRSVAGNRERVTSAYDLDLVVREMTFRMEPPSDRIGSLICETRVSCLGARGVRMTYDPDALHLTENVGIANPVVSQTLLSLGIQQRGSWRKVNIDRCIEMPTLKDGPHRGSGSFADYGFSCWR